MFFNSTENIRKLDLPHCLKKYLFWYQVIDEIDSHLLANFRRSFAQLKLEKFLFGILWREMVKWEFRDRALIWRISCYWRFVCEAAILDAEWTIYEGRCRRNWFASDGWWDCLDLPAGDWFLVSSWDESYSLCS